jgi:hypothetical protein
MDKSTDWEFLDMTDDEYDPRDDLKTGCGKAPSWFDYGSLLGIALYTVILLALWVLFGRFV